MAVTDIATVRKRVISLLMANRLSPYGGVVGTGSSTNSRYQSTQEITDAALEADSLIVETIIGTAGHPYASQFMVESPDIATGGLIPAHTGVQGIVRVDGVVARLAGSQAEISEILANPTLYPNASKWYVINGNNIVHTGAVAKVTYPVFTPGTTVCQSPNVYESAVVAGAISLLAKDGSVTPELYGAMGQFFQRCLQMIAGMQTVLPPVEQAEQMMQAT